MENNQLVTVCDARKHLFWKCCILVQSLLLNIEPFWLPFCIWFSVLHLPCLCMPVNGTGSSLSHFCFDWSRMGWGAHLWSPWQDQELPRNEGSRISCFAGWAASVWIEGLQTCFCKGKSCHFSLHMCNRTLHPTCWRTVSTFKWHNLKVRTTSGHWNFWLTKICHP